VTATPERTPIDRLAASWIAAWVGEGRFERCCTGDVGYEDPLSPQPRAGVAEIAAHAGRLRAAFPDVRVEATAPPLVRGDHACIPWRLSGTHRGDLAHLPATERFLTLHGLHYVELVDDRVRRARGFFDLYDGATQLGLLPERGGLGESALMFLRGFGLRL
jgi:predicted ester cyclase